MNNVIYKFLLTADTFKPEANMRQPEFKYSACGPFTKKKEKKKNTKIQSNKRLQGLFSI